MTKPYKSSSLTALSDKVNVEMGGPTIVAISKAGETRWGFHQFPSLSRLPDGKILCQISSQLDAVCCYGNKAPTFVSSDHGETWQPFENRSLPIAAPHSYITEVLDGEYLYVPPTPPLDLNQTNWHLPKFVGGTFSYSANNFYLFKQCPNEIQKHAQTLTAYRWTQSSKKWNQETINYDMQDALLWTRAKGKEKHLVPRTWFENPLLRVGNALMYADYRQRYLTAEGTVPKSFAPSCMVSTDNGHSFKRRSTIAHDPAGNDGFGECMLASNAKGELVCIIRRTDQNQKPMAITYSTDQGQTWEQPESLHQFGVYPSMILLDCGIMVLAFGRPGIHLSFSLNGVGREWTQPLPVLLQEDEDLGNTTCGYTSLLPLGDNTFLLAYSDFNHQDKNKAICKTILAQKVILHMPKVSD